MRKGSALLVVLGMIAFMVISAVAFSAYMRYSRLPSSYLLRTSSSRHLVKAALAEAIDIIDVSIGNNPHPGVGDKAYPYPRKGGASRQRNYWYNHCFIGTNQLVNAEDTVSTLTMEGLAYLPPALINEARYFSRRSSAAVWKTLGFDSGRFAFSAVDVSDHFDINRLRAAVARDSSDRGRVSLAHIFENDQHTGFAADPSVWDAFVAKYYDPQKPYDTSKVPFTSLADLNLAINYSKPSKVVTPFCRYLESAGGSDFVTSISGEDSAMMRSMAFVTDSYFPRAQPKAGEKADDLDYSLCDEEYQPFRADDLEGTVKSVMTPYEYSSKGATRLRESVCGLSKLALWDYLDEDSVPVSLALPVVERVPMVCAMQMTLAPGQFKLNWGADFLFDGQAENNPPTASGQKRTVTETHHYKVDGQQFAGAFMGGKVKTVVAFPFLRDGSANAQFEIDGRLSLFLADPALKRRTRANDVLHLGAKPDLTTPGVFQTAAGISDGTVNIPFNKQSWRPPNITKEEDALREFEFNLSDNGAANQIATWFSQNDIATVEYQWQQTAQENPATGQLEWNPPTPTPSPTSNPMSKPGAVLNSARCNFPPLNEQGVPHEDYADANNFKNRIVSGGGGINVSFQACVWLRIKDGDGKTVDLVPACMKDDDDLNGFNSFSSPAGAYLKDVAGDNYPLMKFTGSGFSYSLTDLNGTLISQGVNIQNTPPPVMVADPRYNYAPEHWFEMNGTLSAQEWLRLCERGNNGRDRDIFMATSDMGYLQSVYELAFLPRFETAADNPGRAALDGPGDNTYYGNMKRLVTTGFGGGGGATTGFASSFAGTANNHLAWRTYRPFKIGNMNADDFAGVGFNSEGRGFRVNPYSSSTPVIMAALANTPYNWMVASTNETAPNALSRSDREVKNFVKNYCFNQMGPSESRFDWKDLELVAERIKSEVRADTDGNWGDAFDRLDWAGDNSDLAGANFEGSTVDLYDVDRKFLFGYWRDTFAVKQQLFLVFVRAEPLMMGGGAIGQTPPQLGARAVALVWRDPTINDDHPDYPHRTRVLFYRQFD